MRRAALGATLAAALAVLSVAEALADTRWLSCRYTQGGEQRQLAVMFDETRNLAAIFQDGLLTEGTATSITFQAIRSRFPGFFLTYNRNDGSLALALTGGGGFTAGIVHGECRRANPPPGAPRT
jgi:hypothetical protein